MVKIGYDCDVIDNKEVVVFLTEKCNNMCLNCPNGDSFRSKSITYEEVVEFIDNNVSESTIRVALIGGEPTIAPYLFKIIVQVLKINPEITIQINSNGRMFYYDKFIEKIKKIPRRNLEIHVALYGSNSNIHDSITQVKSSFDQTIQGIHNLLGLGYSVDIRNIVSKKNYEDIEEFSQFILREFKSTMPRKVIFVGMDIIGNAKDNEKDLAISFNRTVPIIEKGLDQLINTAVIPEVHLIPVGFFKKKYYDHVVQSGCVDGAFMNTDNCSKCSYEKRCCKLLKSYADIYGTEEHLHIIKGELE